MQKGTLALWATVADTKVQPQPCICLPLGVEPINLDSSSTPFSMCKHSFFQMEGVGKVTQSSWKREQQITLDHKSWFYNVPLVPESWEYFGLCWRDVYYVCVVLCSGLCASPYIHHSLSDAVAQYLRSQPYLPRHGSMTFGCRTSGPRATSARPANRDSPRSGGPCTHGILPLRLLSGLSKVLTVTHHRPGLPRHRLRYGATQVLHA